MAVAGISDRFLSGVEIDVTIATANGRITPIREGPGAELTIAFGS